MKKTILIALVIALALTFTTCKDDDDNSGGSGGKGVAPTITTTTLPGGTVGVVYSQTLAATGDTPITWSITGGTLPDGLTISTAGVISGTPTTAKSSFFTVKAVNAVGDGTKLLYIVINTNPNPIITTSSLPSGAVGTAYSQTLTATGSTPITWSIETGTLPDGLDLSTAGVISGTPSTTGTSSFTVKATNATGNGTKTLSISIDLNGPRTWTGLSNSTFGTSIIFAIAYGNNRFVAGGQYGRMAYSADGASWTAVADSTFDMTDIIRVIAYGGNGRFVSVGQSGKMAYCNW